MDGRFAGIHITPRSPLLGLEGGSEVWDGGIPRAPCVAYNDYIVAFALQLVVRWMVITLDKIHINYISLGPQPLHLACEHRPSDLKPVSQPHTEANVTTTTL